MRPRLSLILALLLAAQSLAQAPVSPHSEAAPSNPRELSVRLYWTQEIREVRISPHAGELRVRLDRASQFSQVAQAVTVRIAEGRFRVGEQSADEAEFLGSYQLETPGHPRVAAAWPLEVRAMRGRLALTVRMPLEDYVAGVLAGESSNFSSDESLKAMAVAVRTYAVRFRGRHQAEGFDFCDTTHCQDLRLGAISDRLRGIAEATEGELLWYQGRPAATYYHRNCGGTTEAVEDAWPGRESPGRTPYLRRLTDSFCAARDRAEWQSEVSWPELLGALLAAGIAVPHDLQAVEVVSRTPSGRVSRLRLRGATSLTVTADAFRLAVGRNLGWEKIRSDLYDVRSDGARFVFHGHGAGHGVGLCQVGAARMGETGSRYEQILSFYYPGTTLGLTAQGLPWQSLGGERMEVLTTRPQQDGELVALAERLIRELEQTTGWQFRARPQVRVYPTVAVYRDATGKPGWWAASTRGRIIRMQPAATLRASGRLEETLRHELLHMLVESRAQRSLPLWFREGLVLALSRGSGGARPGASQDPLLQGSAALDGMLLDARTQDEMRRAYRAAQAQVEALVARYGKEVVLGWVERGLPLELGRR